MRHGNIAARLENCAFLPSFLSPAYLCYLGEWLTSGRRSMMSTREIQEERVRRLNDEGVRDGEYVLYWIQQAQRAE